jgi:hypothetical protein
MLLSLAAGILEFMKQQIGHSAEFLFPGASYVVRLRGWI